MSARALNWAWQQSPEKPQQKLVLAALADRADDDGYAFPSLEWLAGKCAPMSKRSVRRHLDELVATGLVEKTDRHRRVDGTLSVWVYRLKVSSGQQWPVDDAQPVANSGHAGTDQQSLTTSTDVEVASHDSAQNGFDAETAGARDLVAHFIDEAEAVDIDVPKAVIGQIAQNVGKLLKEGQQPQRVWAGLVRMVQVRIVNPAMLPNFVMEAQIPDQPKRRYGYGVQSSEIRADDPNLFGPGNPYWEGP